MRWHVLAVIAVAALGAGLFVYADRQNAARERLALMREARQHAEERQRLADELALMQAEAERAARNARANGHDAGRDPFDRYIDWDDVPLKNDRE